MLNKVSRASGSGRDDFLLRVYKYGCVANGLLLADCCDIGTET